MLAHKQKREYYEAFIERNSEYEGVFFTGIKTTGIFCRPSCMARTPKFENCDFFKDTKAAIVAGYRPCKRCRPLSPPFATTELVQTLIDNVAKEPDKRWDDDDFKTLGANASTVRRQFKKRFGMTFVAYARAKRMGLAMDQLKKGESVINAQIDSGYASGSGFRDAFSKLMDHAPNAAHHQLLKAEWLDTKLGPMIAIVDHKKLYLLEFSDRPGLDLEIQKMREHLNAAIVPGRETVTDLIERELDDYFAGRLKKFLTQVHLAGTEFQNQVWSVLQTIPYGQTWSYQQLATKLGNKNAFRAVARANASNPMPIIIPCHRVIHKDGNLAGYSGGLVRKKWLIDHERSFA